MLRRRTAPIAVLLALTFAFSVALSARPPLTFEERVKAQEAIERVYYAHRIWPKENPTPKPPFGEMVPRGAIEAKVADYLKKEVALARYWKRTITPAEIQGELDRWVRESKDPEMLTSLFRALQDDPATIAECLARPMLLEQAIREAYANDRGIHQEALLLAEGQLRAWTQGYEPLCPQGTLRRSRVTREGTPSGDEKARDLQRVAISLPPEAFSSLREELESTSTRTILKEEGDQFVVARLIGSSKSTLDIESMSFAKTGFEVWWDGILTTLPAGETETPAQAGAYHIGWDGLATLPSCQDIWTATSTGANCPSARQCQAAVWTGTEMIVWGGYAGTSGTNTGGRYNPSTDTWIATSTGANCPVARDNHTAVWTGTEMLVWGGDGGGTTGGRYNPSTNIWTATSTGANCPSARYHHTAIWTGTEMIVWGGMGSVTLNTGGRYNPATDAWSATSTGANCPTARVHCTAVWAGAEMIVWGGWDGAVTSFNTGGRYFPSSDTWVSTSVGTNCPTGRDEQVAVWTGTEMVVWGGDNGNPAFGDGGRYNPATNTWAKPPSTANCPSGRSSASAIWTGSEMIVWGGYLASYDPIYDTGGRYNPTTDTWLPTPTGTNCPAGRYRQSAVWTDTQMIVWGGIPSSNTGGLYAIQPAAIPVTASAMPPFGIVPLTVAFAATATPTGCIGLVEYAWDFGDGATSSQQTPSHQYTGVGTFTWKVTASLNGVFGTMSGTVTVSPSSCTPVLKGTADTSGSALGVALSGSYAYVADGGGNSLRVIDISNPELPAEVGSVALPGYAEDVDVFGFYAYVADGDGGLQIVNMSIPSAPAVVGSIVFSYAEDVTVSGTYAYVADRVGLRVIDISSPTNPVQKGHVALPGTSEEVVLQGPFAYVADGDKGLRVVDVGYPSSPWERGSLDTPGYSDGVAVSGSYAYVADGGSGLRVIEISSPTHPVERGFLDTPGQAFHVAISGHFAYLGDWDGGFRIIDVTDPTVPEEAGAYVTASPAMGVAKGGYYAYVAEQGDGLGIYQVCDSGCTLSCTASAPASAITGDSVSFTSSATPSGCEGAPSFLWTFGDGQTSIQKNSAHTYTVAGTYTWTMTAEVQGATCAKTGSIVVTAPCSLTCTGDVTPSSGQAPLTVEYSASSTPVNCQGVVTYAWDFGDGGTSTQSSSTYTYRTPGTYPWTMTATIAGVTCSITGSVTVSQAPVCSLSCTASATPDSGPAPLSVNFIASATPTDCTGEVAYSWAFGDGEISAEQNPPHTYGLPGTYSWILTASVQGVTCTQTGTITVSGVCQVVCAADAPETGEVGTPVAFTAAATPTYCQGTPSFSWDFGDGGGSAIQNPHHTYLAPGEYHWIMTVTVDGISCTDTGTITISSNCTLTCTGEATPSAGIAPLSVNFAGTATTAQCLGTPTYTWDFGDGQNSTSAAPTHIYAKPGTFSWTLVVTVDGVPCIQEGSVWVVANPTPSLLQVGSASVTPGNDVTVPLTLTNQGADVCGLTTDLAFDPTKLDFVEIHVGPSADEAGKTVSADVISAGVVRVAIVGFNVTPMGDGVVVDVTFHAAQGATGSAAVDHTCGGTDCAGTVLGMSCPGGTITFSSGIPGDCDDDGAISIGEVQKAINMFLGLIPPDCGVDCNGDGQVSIGEVQKVINAFLGMGTGC